MTKLILGESALGLTALACVHELYLLAWLSATPVTDDHLRVIRIEFWVTLTILALVAFVAVALPFLFKAKRGQNGTI
jgi:hypothetical protein